MKRDNLFPPSVYAKKKKRRTLLENGAFLREIIEQLKRSQHAVAGGDVSVAGAVLQKELLDRAVVNLKRVEHQVSSVTGTTSNGFTKMFMPS